MLRAKKPLVSEARFKAVVYANRGVGKTHFCCSFPDSYYIDSEGLSSYPHFIKMLNDNNSDIVSLHDLTEIIKEVNALLFTKHHYKTLIIDSLTFPAHLLSNMEADRLSKNGKTDGSDYGRNLAKSKRLTFELGMLLCRLDMNCIVVCHEKTRFQNGEEVGKTSDANEKIEYSLGTVINLRRTGNHVRAFIEKSRYPELKANELIEFSNGYEIISSRLGKNVFERVVIPEELATQEQLSEFKRLTHALNVSEDIQIKWKINERSSSIEQMKKDSIQKYIDAMTKKTQPEEGSNNV